MKPYLETELGRQEKIDRAIILKKQAKHTLWVEYKEKIDKIDRDIAKLRGSETAT